MTTAVATRENNVDALVKRVMFPRVPEDETTMTLLLCQRYGLDPLLKHIVLIYSQKQQKHTPYVTRDGLLHIAHSSGAFDGMSVELGQDDFGKFAEATVHRSDMKHPFVYKVYREEYDTKKHAWASHPRSMLIKTAEVFALRRAFDVALTPVEEMGQVTDTENVVEAVDAETVQENTEAEQDESGDISQKQMSAIWTRLGKCYGSADKVRDRFREWLVDEGMMDPPDGEDLTLKQLSSARASHLLEDETWERSMKRFGEFDNLIGLILSADLDPVTLKKYCIAKGHVKENKAGAFPWCGLNDSARKLIEESPEPLNRQVRDWLTEQGGE